MYSDVEERYRRELSESLANAAEQLFVPPEKEGQRDCRLKRLGILEDMFGVGAGTVGGVADRYTGRYMLECTGGRKTFAPAIMIKMWPKVFKAALKAGLMLSHTRGEGESLCIVDDSYGLLIGASIVEELTAQRRADRLADRRERERMRSVRRRAARRRDKLGTLRAGN